MPVLYQGEQIEGVGRCYDSNSKSVMWGHVLVSSVLVRLGEDPYLLRCDPFPDELMSVLAEVGVVQLLIVWKEQGVGWHLTTLISTLKAGIQEVQAWSARWSLEVSHRLRKQNLALGACQRLAYAAHLQHAELVNQAFRSMRQERQRTPGLNWKLAQQLAAETLRNALLTEKSPIAA